MNDFSDELIERTIKCFAEEHDHFIDRETAIVYLGALSDFYRAFAEAGNDDR